MFPVEVTEISPVTLEGLALYWAKQFLVVVEKEEECKTWQGDWLSKKEQVQSLDAEKLKRFL